jgi:predicted esterase
VKKSCYRDGVATLLVLHGYTMNSDTMREHIAPLSAGFPPDVSLVIPAAPHACSEASVERFYAGTGLTRLPPPYLTWWDATDDGSEYRGWEQSRDALAALVEQHAPVGVLGFSQGAIVASVLSAMASRGILPGLSFVILVAGGTPRATALAPLFDDTIRIPSLHVWGERDGLAERSRELSGRFDESTSSVVTWPGGHRVPPGGPAADAIADFVRRA